MKRQHVEGLEWRWRTVAILRINSGVNVWWNTKVFSLDLKTANVSLSVRRNPDRRSRAVEDMVGKMSPGCRFVQ